MSNYVEWFVNRVKQHEGFLKMLARQTEKQIMLIESPSELGKTWLIQYELLYCRAQQIPVAVVDFRDRQPWDYLLLVRQFRDQLGAQHFNYLTETINQATAVNVNLATGGTGGNVVNVVGGATGAAIAGDVVGGNKVVIDQLQVVQVDSETARRTIELRITDAFIDCLKQLSTTLPVVFLFDSYEDVTTEADRWLRYSFLARVRDKLIPNVIVLLAGRKTIEIDDTWKPVVARTGLANFEEKFVVEYIIDKRKLQGLDLATIWKTSAGHPGLLAKMADIATIDTADDKDWGL